MPLVAARNGPPRRYPAVPGHGRRQGLAAGLRWLLAHAVAIGPRRIPAFDRDPAEPVLPEGRGARPLVERGDEGCEPLLRQPAIGVLGASIPRDRNAPFV